MTPPEIVDDFTLLHSNLNQPPLAVMTAGSRGLTEYHFAVNRKADGPGYDGVELTPTRSYELSVSGNRADESGHLTSIIESLHQTWAVNRAEIFAGKRSPLDIAGYLAMRPSCESLKAMRRFSPEHARLPLVAYAEQQDPATGMPRTFVEYAGAYAGIYTQFKPELFQAYGFDNPRQTPADSLSDRLQAADVDGFVIDTHHLTRSSWTDPDYRLDGDAVLDTLADPGLPTLPLRGVHAAIGRIDNPHQEDRGRSLRELKALIEGPDQFARTEAASMLAASVEIWRGQQERHKALPIVVEMPYKGLRYVATEMQGRSNFDTQEACRLTAVVTDHLRAIIGREFARI